MEAKITLPTTTQEATIQLLIIQRREYWLKSKNAWKDSRANRDGRMVRILPAVDTLGPKADRII